MYGKTIINAYHQNKMIPISLYCPFCNVVQVNVWWYQLQFASILFDGLFKLFFHLIIYDMPIQADDTSWCPSGPYSLVNFDHVLHCSWLQWFSINLIAISLKCNHLIFIPLTQTGKHPVWSMLIAFIVVPNIIRWTSPYFVPWGVVQVLLSISCSAFAFVNLKFWCCYFICPFLCFEDFCSDSLKSCEIVVAVCLILLHIWRSWGLNERNESPSLLMAIHTWPDLLMLFSLWSTNDALHSSCSTLHS